jgi:DNA-binding HxlR family transcriptional regulator
MSATIEMTGVLEPRDSWTAERCSVGKALEVVRNRASVLILREAFYGATRFEEFVERAQLSEPVCAARLRELTAEGIFTREPYQEPGQRTRNAYRLTEKGTDLLPVLIALMQWGDRWQQERGAPVEIHHAGCGGRVSVELRCDHDHAVDDDQLQLVRPARRPRSAE